MAQHVGYSRAPATFLLVLGIFHLVNHVELTVVSANALTKINSVRLIERNDNLRNTSWISVHNYGLLVVLENSVRDDDEIALRWSPHDEDCEKSTNELQEVARTGNQIFFKFPDDCCFGFTDVYFCRRTVSRHGVLWPKLGDKYAVRLPYNEWVYELVNTKKKIMDI